MRWAGAMAGLLATAGVCLSDSARAEVSGADLKALQVLQGRSGDIASGSLRALRGMIETRAGSEDDRFCLDELARLAELANERIEAVTGMVMLSQLAAKDARGTAQLLIFGRLTDEAERTSRQATDVKLLGAKCAGTPFAPEEASKLTRLLEDASAGMIQIRNRL
jgi:hypothetical protein